jgi:hypothetical protein
MRNEKYCGNLSSQEIIHYYQRDRRSFSIIILSILKGQPCLQFISPVDPYHMLYSWEYFSQGINLLQFISNCAASVLKH